MGLLSLLPLAGTDARRSGPCRCGNAKPSGLVMLSMKKKPERRVPVTCGGGGDNSDPALPGCVGSKVWAVVLDMMSVG